MSGTSDKIPPNLGKQTRVDGPHHGHRSVVATTATNAPPHAVLAPGASPASASPIQHKPAASPAVLQAIAGRQSAEYSVQLERQASQLGSQLQTQQRDLDMREAEFHARVARMENELRTARLLHREKEQEIHEREIEFNQRCEQLRSRTADISAAELALSSTDQQQQTVSEYSAHVKQAIHKWETRFQQLEVSENQLQAQLADIADERESLRKLREEALSEQAEGRERLAENSRRTKEKLEQRRQALDQRADELDRRQIALQQLHGEVTRMSREAMELRICNEELAGQLLEKITPAELTASLAQLRRKLADQFQLAQESLAQQDEQLQQLVGRLKQHQADLDQRRQHVQDWVARRQEELEHQATILIEREQQIQRDAANFRHFEQAWQDRRREYEQEIRRLRRHNMAA